MRLRVVPRERTGREAALERQAHVAACLTGAHWAWAGGRPGGAPYPRAPQLLSGTKYDLFSSDGVRVAKGSVLGGVLRLKKVETTQRCLIGQTLLGNKGDGGHAGAAAGVRARRASTKKGRRQSSLKGAKAAW